MNIFIVDKQNRLILDVSKEDLSIIYSNKLCDVDFLDGNIRVRIKRNIVPDDKDRIDLLFKEGADTDHIVPHLIRRDNG